MDGPAVEDGAENKVKVSRVCVGRDVCVVPNFFRDICVVPPNFFRDPCVFWSIDGALEDVGVLDGVGGLDVVVVRALDGVGAHYLCRKIAEEAVREEVGGVEGREEMGGEGVSEDEGDE